MLCIEGKLTLSDGMAVSLSPTGIANGSLSKEDIQATLSADAASASLTSHPGIVASLSTTTREAHLTSAARPVATLAKSSGVQAVMTSDLGIAASLNTQGGILSTLDSNIVTATMTPDYVEATLTCVPVDAYFSYSCPIDDIKACFSLGGWDDNLGWDDEMGWKN